MKADGWSRDERFPDMETYGFLCEGAVWTEASEGGFRAAVILAILNDVVRRQFPDLGAARAWVEAEVALKALKDLA